MSAFFGVSKRISARDAQLTAGYLVGPCVLMVVSAVSWFTDTHRRQGGTAQAAVVIDPGTPTVARDNGETAPHGPVGEPLVMTAILYESIVLGQRTNTYVVPLPRARATIARRPEARSVHRPVG